MMFGLDPLYMIMILPVFLLSLYASVKVKTTFNKYSKIGNRSGITGAQAAQEILRRNGLSNVTVQETGGFLSDHYDPSKRVIRLSPDVYRGNSIAAVGVAAHEAGHAIQHKLDYKPLALCNTMVPLASIGSWAAWIIIPLGLFFSLFLAKVGIVLFCAVVFFQVITLPVEFNASSRAKAMLSSYGIVPQSDVAGVEKVLSAAAMTYVAAAASAVMTLLYFLLRTGLLGGRDD